MKLICNPSTDSASEASNIDITKHEIPAPASKRIVWDPLQIHHACQRFCNPQKPRRLPRILQRLEIPAPATRNAGVVQILRSSTSKSDPKPSSLNDFDFRIALARSRGANFAKLNFQKKALRNPQVLTILTSKSAPSLPVFDGFDFQIALARKHGANFVNILGSRSSAPPRFSELTLRDL